MGRSPLPVDAVVETRDRRFFLMSGNGRYMVALEAICLCSNTLAPIQPQLEERTTDGETLKRSCGLAGPLAPILATISSSALITTQWRAVR